MNVNDIPADPSVSKAAPSFSVACHGRTERIFNLIWFVGQVMKAAPVASLIWIATSIVRSLVIPLNLWVTKYLVDAVVDAVTLGVSMRDALFWLLGLALGLLVQWSIGWIDPWLSIKFRSYSARRLTQVVLGKAPRLKLEDFEHQEYHDRLYRIMSDIENRGPDIVEEFLEVARTLSSIIGYAAVLFLIHPLTLVIVSGFTLISVVISLSGGQSVWSALNQQTFDRRLGDYYGSIIVDRRAAKEVRLFSLGRFLLHNWSDLYWKTRNELRQKALRIDLRQMAIIGIGVIANVGALYWIALNPPQGASPGLYTILFEAIMGLGNPLHQLAATVRELGVGSGYVSDFRYFLNLREFGQVPSGPEIGAEVVEEYNSTAINEPRDTSRRRFPRPLQRSIEFEGVTYTYPGSQRPAVRDLSLEIHAGEKVAIVGENGSGKTTFSRLLLGLNQPDSGRILADGIDYMEIEHESLTQSVSAVMQSFVRYNLTFAENIAFSGAHDKKMQPVLHKAVMRSGSAETLESLSDGYSTMIGPEMGGVDLSGGHWQRVALARAFFRNSEILLLDEPTAALDPLTEFEVFERFQDLANGRTFVMISHRLGVTRLADRILVFNDGEIIEEGNHDQLIAAGGEYAGHYKAQARWYE